MELANENREKILALLKAGQRDAALRFIAAQYGTSDEDSKKLLKAFELQYGNFVKPETSTKSPNLSGCSGCLSAVLKVISILIGVFGIGSFAVGYFIPNLFGDEWNNQLVPVVVSGKSYSRPDSSYVNLIYQYPNGAEIKTDTGTVEYVPDQYLSGDTIHVTASELDMPWNDDLNKKLRETQQGVYLFGGILLFIATLFWFTGSIFKSRAKSG